MTLSHETILASLIDLMSDISEEHYCAGWLIDLEYDLYGIVVGDRLSSFGMAQVSDERITRLKELTETLGGWTDGEKFIALADWLKLYEPHRDEYRAKNWWPCAIGWCVKHHPEERDKPHLLGVNMECGQ